MATDMSSNAYHIIKNLSLIYLSLLFIPIDAVVLACSYVLPPFFSRQSPAASPLKRKTILVTGVSMTKGLTLARLLSRSGHRVVGADASAMASGRYSIHVSKFYALQPPKADSPGPYIESLLRIVQTEKVDLWVSCSGVASAIEDAMAKEILEGRTKCKAVQFNVEDTRTLHEKDTFINAVKDAGLLVPETHTVKRRDDLLEVLGAAHGEAKDAFDIKPMGDLTKEKGRGKQFIMKPIGMDDAARGDMTLLPKPSWSDTEKHVQRLKIDDQHPWILQEFIQGREFCTHALVVRKEVKAFVACPSAELLMHYEALPRDNALSMAMLDFTESFASKQGPDFTGHLSFDFLVKEQDVEKYDPKHIRLYPIECNPRAHTAVVLFRDTPAMAETYMSVFSENERSYGNGYAGADQPVAPVRPQKYYWIPHDFVTYVLLPIFSLATGQGTLDDLSDGFLFFGQHLLWWKDGTFELQDPLPWFVLYHLYWPAQFAQSLRAGKWWSRVNVSTGKMFGVE